MSAVNAIWFMQKEPVTAEEFSASIRIAEAGIRAQYEANGQILRSYEVGEPVASVLWGMPALICDSELLVSVNSTDVILVQRAVRITDDWGTYLFSLSAWSSDLLEKATESLIRSLSWK